MTDENDKLRGVAQELRAKGGYWATFNVNDLMEWLEHEGTCTYCSASIVDEYHVTNRLGTWDHLLPKAKYLEIENHPLNRVPCCMACNCLKSSWDPNSQVLPRLYEPENGRDINTEIQQQLITRSKQYVEKKRAERNANFPSEHANWLAAMSKLGRSASA